MKTTIEIKELNCNDYSDCNTPDEYNNKLYNFMNKKWYSEEELKELLKEMEHDCSNCYTGLTKDSDFENAFATMNNIVFNEFKKLFGEKE